MSRTKRYKHGDAFPMVVRQQGAIVVNDAVVIRDYGDCILISVDLTSKYAEQLCTGSSVDEGPTIGLIAGERTLYIEGDRDSVTDIEFPECKGWSVFSVGGPARYTMDVTLIEDRYQ